MVNGEWWNDVPIAISDLSGSDSGITFPNNDDSPHASVSLIVIAPMAHHAYKQLIADWYRDWIFLRFSLNASVTSPVSGVHISWTIFTFTGISNLSSLPENEAMNTEIQYTSNCIVYWKWWDIFKYIHGSRRTQLESISEIWNKYC